MISPSLTFVAANQTILQAGGKIVFSDCDPETLSTDVNDVLNKITRKTKAILVLHYGGHPMDLKPLTKVCREKQITLIEDCAHAAGSYYYGRHVGGFGDLGCFSFAAIKNITTGDGGMVVTNDKAKADRIRHLAWSGISSSTWKRYSGRQPHKWEYAVTDLGFKYQMNDISASIGLIQLAKLVKTNARRQKIYQRYNQAFISLSWLSAPPVKSWARSSHHNYFIQVKAKIRDRFIDYLNAKGISANVHYLPNHYYPMFKSFPSQVPTVEKVWPKIVMLPIYPDLSLADQKQSSRQFMILTKLSFTGAFWLGLLKVVIKAFSFLKLIIVARILTPADFGWFGIVMLPYGLVEVMTESGMYQALVQTRKDVRQYFSSAWVAFILRGFLISAVLFVVAPFISRFYQADLTLAIRLVGLTPFLKGLANPAVVLFRKEMNFKQEFMYQSLASIAESVATIILAVKLRTLIALPLGIVCGGLAFTFLSFIFSRVHFSRISFTKIKELFAYGKWVTVGTFVSYLNDQGDDFLVSKVLGAYSLGLYQTAYKISNLTTTQGAGLIYQIIFPIFFHDSNRNHSFEARYSKSSDHYFCFKRGFLPGDLSFCPLAGSNFPGPCVARHDSGFKCFTALCFNPAVSFRWLGFI